jgi:hypothetical protein
MCFRTETPGARCTTLVSVAELAPLVVVVPALLASPSVAFALRRAAVSPALEVVVAADSTEPIAFPPPVSQFPSFAASLFRDPVTGWEPVETNKCVDRLLEAEPGISRRKLWSSWMQSGRSCAQAPHPHVPPHLQAHRPSLGTATRVDCSEICTWGQPTCPPPAPAPETPHGRPTPMPPGRQFQQRRSSPRVRDTVKQTHSQGNNPQTSHGHGIKLSSDAADAGLWDLDFSCLTRRGGTGFFSSSELMMSANAGGRASAAAAAGNNKWSGGL